MEKSNLSQKNPNTEALKKKNKNKLPPPQKKHNKNKRTKTHKRTYNKHTRTVQPAEIHCKWKEGKK